MDSKADSKDKIILPKNLQREMIKFFLLTSVPKIAANSRQRQKEPERNPGALETRPFAQQKVLKTSPKSNEAKECLT